MIATSDFEGVIPEHLRPFILVESATLPEGFRPVLEAFGTAVRCLDGKIKLRRPVHIIVGAAPFKVHLQTGTLSYTPRGEVINMALEDAIIFLDAVKMVSRPQPVIVACILEEFAHAAMSVLDEELASRIVSLLFPGIKLVDGKYSAS